MKYKTTIHKDMNYFCSASSSFEEGDFSWREFTSEYVPLLLNWIAKFSGNNVPVILRKVNNCIKHLHINCDDMNKNIRKILLLGKFQSIDDAFKHYRKNNYFPNIIVCFYFYQLMLNCVGFKKNITKLQEIFLDIVKKYSANKNYLSL